MKRELSPLVHMELDSEGYTVVHEVVNYFSKQANESSEQVFDDVENL